MSSTIINITFDSADPRALASFWGHLTGWPVHSEPQPGYPDCAVEPAAKGAPRLYFVRVPEGKTVKNRVHLDVMPAGRTQQDEITRLLGLGATVVSDRRPDVGWVILADPEGNEFCVEMSEEELAEASRTSGEAPVPG